MKKRYYLYTIVLILITLTAGCKNPAEDVKVVVDMNIIKYSALVRITDASGAIPQNITLSVGGDAGDDIYEISGKKDFTVKDGVITLGLSPSVTPAAGKDVSFTIAVNASGCKQTVQTITFSNGKMQQVIGVSLNKTSAVTTPAAPVVTPPAATATTVSLDFTGYCASKPNLQIRPNLYVFYREKGANAIYQYLGYISNGKITTNLLTMGKTYEFQITYGNENYTVTEQINQTSYAETFNMGNAICNTF